MGVLLRLTPLAAALLAAPLFAGPADYASAIASKARTEANRQQDAARRPAEILDFAGVARGQVVADWFSGEGYWTELFARAVGSRGTVYAIDPPSFHDKAKWEPIQAAHPNVRVLVAPVAQMQLAPGSVDLFFTNANYHDLYWESERFKFPRVEVQPVLADWFRAVKPGGHVVIIDHAGPEGDPRALAEKLHRIDPARVKADMAAAGFVLEAESSLLQRSDDPHDKSVFDPAVRGKTDRFVLKFRHP